jgi:phosphoserine phosphatase SerB
MQQYTAVTFEWSDLTRPALIQWVDECLSNNITLTGINAEQSRMTWFCEGDGNLSCSFAAVLQSESTTRPAKAASSVITVMHPELSLAPIVAVCQWLAERQLLSVKIDWMTAKAENIEALNIYLEQDACGLRHDILSLADELGVDVVVQPNTAPHQDIKLLVMDMDSTLIQIEVIDELAKIAGVGDQVVEITEQAMQGKLDFSQSLRKRVGLLKGLSESAIDEVAERLPLSPGAERLITTLKNNGCKTAILSGGFAYFASRLQQKLGIDYIHSNYLAIVEQQLTGEVEGTIVDATEKRRLLGKLTEDLHIQPEQTMAVGDGANDLLMIEASGFGVAYKAKPVVQQKAPAAIKHMGLDGLLYIMGLIPVEGC